MIGGAEVFHQKTAEWLVRNGHQVDVVTCIWDKPDIPWKNWLKKKEIINGVTVYRVKPWFYQRYLKSIGAIWPLYQKSLQLIEDGSRLAHLHPEDPPAGGDEGSHKNYDLIHAHIFPALIVGALLKKKTALPLITTIQGGDVADYSETGSKLGLILKPIISWSLKQTNLVHTVSTHMENSVKKLGVTNTKVIPNGVDTLLFKPRNKKKLRTKYEIPNTKYVIISHSRLTPKNGLDILIRAIYNLTDKKQILVLLVGGGEQEQELRELVISLKLTQQIKFLGYKNRRVTAELLSLSDLFVRPSREEGFGIAFIEAMASGLPVIGTSIGGITGIINNGETGLLVAKSSSVLLEKMMNRLLNDRPLCSKLGNAARREVESKYNWGVVARQLDSLYSSSVNK